MYHKYSSLIENYIVELGITMMIYLVKVFHLEIKIDRSERFEFFLRDWRLVGDNFYLHTSQNRYQVVAYQHITIYKTFIKLRYLFQFSFRLLSNKTNF